MTGNLGRGKRMVPTCETKKKRVKAWWALSEGMVGNAGCRERNFNIGEKKLRWEEVRLLTKRVKKKKERNMVQGMAVKGVF